MQEEAENGPAVLLFHGRAAKLTCVHYNMRVRHARDDPTFEPECLPPMELDPTDAEADDFDDSE